MNLGYSLLLREYVSAPEVDYGDCGEFQIVCPACHEAIFKAGRYGQDRQYFSHYAASKSDVSTCELRVLAITHEAVTAKNIFAHGQSIDRFFDKPREFVLSWLYGDEAPAIRKRLNWMIARQSFIDYGSHLRRIVTSREETHRETLRTLIAKALSADRSTFWLKRQSDFASGFIDHLTAPNSLSLFLFFIALAVVLNKDMPEAKTVFTHGNDKQMNRGLGSLDEDAFHMVNTSLLRTFDFLLVLIPYVEMLADQTTDVANKNLLFEIIDRNATPKGAAGI